MPLEPGSRLGSHCIVSAIGAGGMGEVYKATDTRLDRTVAIKVLPAELAGDRSRRERLAREAKAIAALSHPHICTLYEFDHQDGIDFLVMEHLEGETLAARIARKGALPLADTLRYATEIADALDTAHRQRITHRDLKPSNVILTKAGAKLLDFGLAKLRDGRATVASGGASEGETATTLPTMSGALTGEGRIVGTLQYMAPEQLEGKEADARSDLFAFGAVLYEMTTGHRAFEGTSQASLIAAILDDEARPITELVPAAPAALDRVVVRCLAKDPDDRWQTAADMKEALGWVSMTAPAGGQVETTSGWRAHRERLTWGVAIVVVMVAAAVIAGRLDRARAVADAPTVRFVMDPLPGDELVQGAGPNFALSPDGRTLVYVARRDDDARLYQRPMSGLEASPLRDTEGASAPFFSPDGQWVGFHVGLTVRKVSLAGGPAQTLGEIPITITNLGSIIRGASWTRDDTIVLGVTGSSLWSVPASGGSVEPLTTLDTERGEEQHIRPHALPDGEHILFTIASGRGDDRLHDVVVQSLRSGERRVVLEWASHARYVESGHIVYALMDASGVTTNALWVVPFDLERLEVTGDPVPVQEDLQLSNNAVQFALSAAGSLVYVSSDVPADDALQMVGAPGRLAWVGRDGNEAGVIMDEPVAAPRYLDLAPDGTRVAVTVGGGAGELWVHHLDGRPARPLTQEAHNVLPVWHPDGRRVAFASTRGGQRNLFSMPDDGRGSDVRRLASAQNQQFPTSWSPDGRELIYWEERPGTGADILALEIGYETQPRVVIGTEHNETQGELSPDARWLAYVADATGEPQVWVVPYPTGTPPIRISREGGSEPRWSHDGRELFFLEGERMMVASVEWAQGFRAGTPELLFEGGFVTYMGAFRHYDVADDGRFLMIRSVTSRTTEEARGMVVVLNWL